MKMGIIVILHVNDILFNDLKKKKKETRVLFPFFYFHFSVSQDVNVFDKSITIDTGILKKMNRK